MFDTRLARLTRSDQSRKSRQSCALSQRAPPPFTPDRARIFSTHTSGMRSGTSASFPMCGPSPVARTRERARTVLDHSRHVPHVTRLHHLHDSRRIGAMPPERIHADSCRRGARVNPHATPAGVVPTHKPPQSRCVNTHHHLKRYRPAQPHARQFDAPVKTNTQPQRRRSTLRCRG